MVYHLELCGLTVNFLKCVYRHMRIKIGFWVKEIFFFNFILFFVHHSQPKSNQVFRETIIQFIFFVPENIKRKKIQFFILFLEENKALKLLLETQ
jgi:hypothetical protein